MYIPDAEETVPVWRFGDDGKVQNIRPSSFHLNAETDFKKHGSRGVVGYKVRNNYGEIKKMTFKQYHRLFDLFRRNVLEVVEYWYDQNLPAEYGMAGYDTECVNSGIMERPNFND